jgi:hypothetical protein
MTKPNKTYTFQSASAKGRMRKIMDELAKGPRNCTELAEAVYICYRSMQYYLWYLVDIGKVHVVSGVKHHAQMFAVVVPNVQAMPA